MSEQDDHVHKTATSLLQEAQRFWDAKQLAGEGAAVVWVEDTEGRVLIFTRGEYRDAIMAAIGHETPVRVFRPEGDA